MLQHCDEYCTFSQSCTVNFPHFQYEVTKFVLVTTARFENNYCCIYLFVCLKIPYLAPPKHDPVVIKLGEDSESEDSCESDSEIGQKTGSKDKGSSGGLFGGLEMMIKEARKSAEVIANYYLIQPLLEKKLI